VITITGLSTSRTNERQGVPKVLKHIGLLVFEDFFMATAGAIGEAFRLANKFEKARGEDPPYQLSVLSDEGGLVRSSSGISIGTQRLDRYSVSDFHAFFMARSVRTAAAEPDDRFLSWITGEGTIVSSRIMRGSKLAVVYRDTSGSTVPIFLVDDSFGEVQTGGMTPTDLALAQIESDLSTDIARKIALELHTDFVEETKSVYDNASIVTTTRRVRESARWIKENYSKPISVAQAAESASMSKRNFQRRFKCEFDMTPLEYLLRARFEVARNMLRTTNVPVDKIARRCGLGDGNRLGRLFKKRYGMSPTQFRAQQHLEFEELWPASSGGRDIAAPVSLNTE
jgi:transcriptional regulator GlxA family with amidase domain